MIETEKILTFQFCTYKVHKKQLTNTCIRPFDVRHFGHNHHSSAMRMIDMNICRFIWIWCCRFWIWLNEIMPQSSMKLNISRISNVCVCVCIWSVKVNEYLDSCLKIEFYGPSIWFCLLLNKQYTTKKNLFWLSFDTSHSLCALIVCAVQMCERQSCTTRKFLRAANGTVLFIPKTHIYICWCSVFIHIGISDA